MSNRQFTQRGDTIVEVLLAMAVVGMVLGSSFGIANRSLRIGRSAQERTTALKIAESQLELMKSTDRASIEALTSDFCMTDLNSSGFAQAGPSSAECTDINGDGNSGLFTVAISPPSTGGVPSFAIGVSWDRLGAAGTGDTRDTVTLYYKPGVL